MFAKLVGNKSVLWVSCLPALEITPLPPRAKSAALEDVHVRRAQRPQVGGVPDQRREGAHRARRRDADLVPQLAKFI